jgi:polyhydroxyalkanoate synthase
MIELTRRALDKGLLLNERAADAASNGFDWLFRRSELVLSGLTDHEVIFASDPMSVRYYSLDGVSDIDLADGTTLPVQRTKHPVPLVLIPPLGVTTETFDLMPNRSLVRYMAAQGFQVYLVCWGKPERRHAPLDMADYADRLMGEALSAVRAHSASQAVSLMGWCMGGLLALLHAGLDGTRGVQNIVTVASPIDMRGGGLVAGVAQAINTPARLIRKYSDFSIYALNPRALHAPGWVTSLAFKLTDPVGSVTTYWDLLTKLWDRRFVESHTTTSHYLNNMLPYPVGIVQDVVAKMAVGNQFAKGEFKLGKKMVRFKSIQAPMLVFAGETDVLVQASAARGILDLVDSHDTSFETAPGGHMGVILGAQAQSVVWARSASWLGQRSGGSASAKVASKKATLRKPGKRKQLLKV